MQIGSEKGGFVSASSSSDLNNRWSVIQWVVRQERRLHTQLDLREIALEPHHFRACLCGELQVVS
jgi:hypothetical protein